MLLQKTMARKTEVLLSDPIAPAPLKHTILHMPWLSLAHLMLVLSEETDVGRGNDDNDNRLDDNNNFNEYN